MRRLRVVRRFMSELPLGTKLYFYIWTLLVPVGLALLFAGLVVPGLLLLALFVIEQAIVVPLLAARSQKRPRP
jgi:hypothetical protein